jgi:Domain of unknown function (DUF4178)/MORN repeat variant
MAGDELKTTTQQKPASVKVFDCPSCGAGVVITAVGLSLTAVCRSCAAIIDSSNENYRVLEMAAKSGKRIQVIPIGQRGKFRGVVWQVIGYVERTDDQSAFTWSEYLLYNPIKGFRWLTESDGHWNYVITTKTKPVKIDSKRITHLNKSFDLFHRGSAKVIFVVGEFYWQVKQGETVAVEDYVAPPEILSLERSNKEIIWSLGEYVSSNEVKTAFQITAPMPLQSGIAPNQPSALAGKAKYAGKYWGLFLCILFVTQLGAIVLSKNQTVYSGQFTYTAADTEKLKVLPQFEVGGGIANLEITVSSPVRNNWIEVQSDLVNDDNGETEEFEQGIEYYYGTDSDGPWTEGSQTSSVILSSIPAGKYHLNMEASGPALPTQTAAEAEPIITPKNAIPRTEQWPNGKLKSMEPILNGKIVGIAKYFHDNGRVYSEIPYKNGKKHGRFKLFRPDGSLEQELNYLNGKLSGSAKWYDNNGNVSQTANYVDGVVAANQTASDSVSLNVVVKRDVTTWSNFFWALILVSVFPIFVLWRKHTFEGARWSQSSL